MPPRDEIHALSDELGVTYNDADAGVTLWDMRNESPQRLECLSGLEMEELTIWWTDGCCPVCFEEIPLDDVICNRCYRRAASVRAGK